MVRHKHLRLLTGSRSPDMATRNEVKPGWRSHSTTEAVVVLLRVPMTHMVERETYSYQVSSDFHMWAVPHADPSTYSQINKYYKNSNM